MQVKTEQTGSYPLRGIEPWVFLGISGFSALFLVGFPFANHNESFLWVVKLRETTLPEFLGLHVSTWRPLGNLLGWLSFHWGGGSVVLSQGLNWVSTAAALWFLIRGAVCPRVVSLYLFIGGTVLFTGFIYLFHLHGVFYPGVFLAIAVCIHASRNPDAPATIPVTALVGVVFAFLHPFATLGCLGFLAGRWIVRFRTNTVREHQITAGSLCILAATIVLLRPPGRSTDVTALLNGWLVTYRMLVPNRIAEAAVLGLTLVASMGRGPARRRIVLMSCAIASIAVVISVSLPFALAPVLAAGMYAVVDRRWDMLGLLAATVTFPLGAGNGGPVYGLFSIFVAIFMQADISVAIENLLKRLSPPYVLGAAMGVLLCGVAVRAGIDLPVVSRVTQPLVAEREKTWAFEAVLDSLAVSSFCDRRLLFADPKTLPVRDPPASLRRATTPPAGQESLDAYWNMRRCGSSFLSPLILTFGDRTCPECVCVMLIRTRTGAIRVWECTDFISSAGGP